MALISGARAKRFPNFTRDATVIIVGQRSQRSRSAACERGPVHQRQRPRRKACEAPDRRAHGRIEARMLNTSSAAIAGPSNVALGQCQIVAKLGEEIAEEQGSCRFRVEDGGVPAVWRMGVSTKRTRLPAPTSIVSPSFSARGERSAKSASETRQSVCPCAGVALGAAASHSFIAPHS